MSETLTPPPFVERYKYNELKQINDKVTRKRVYLTPDGEQLPSVTTILSSTKDMTHLNEWRKRVGEENARRITTEAAGIGTAMHGNLERFLVGMQRQPGNNPVHVQANKMADVIIENGLKDVDEVWAMEQSLYFPGLYSGTTDLCGVYDNEESIIDFKSSTKTKKREWITDYFLQTCAYALAHNLQHETNIKQGVILICTPKLEFQEFIIKDNEFLWYQKKFIERVSKYQDQLRVGNE